MSYYAVRDSVSFAYPASTVTRAQGGFGSDDQEVIGRWVQRGTGNTVVLVADNAQPLGVIVSLEANAVGVDLGPFAKGKRGPDAVIARGSRLTGATRQESASGTAERGFVKAGSTTNLANYLNSVGHVFDGGETVTANSPAGFVEALMYK